MVDAKIQSLSITLQKNETDIREGSKKLSLTPSILQDINSSIIRMQNLEISSSQSPSTIKNLKFLQELFYHTQKLIITQGVKCNRWQVDLQGFYKLKHLELSRIPMQVIEGLQSLRSKLEVLVCIRCSDSFEDIVGSCDQPWKELRTMKLSYNNIDFISSFVNTPVLQYLDLSYNKISNNYDLTALTNLKYLNLSFNHLESVPELSDEVCEKLQVLILSNNYIFNITAVGLMVNLKHLDVSGNLLAQHSAVTPVIFLQFLEHLNFLENPISYHQYHRFYTCSYLNKDINKNQFILDGKVLSYLEQTVVGSRGQTAGKRVRTTSNSSNQVCVGFSEVTTLNKSSTSRKGGRVKEAVIFDGIDQLGNPTTTKVQLKDTGNTDHLETKKQLETLRETIGKDHWLHSQSGSFVQDLLGLQKAEGSSRQLTSTPYETDYLSTSPNFSSAKPGINKPLIPAQNVDISNKTLDFITTESSQTSTDASNTDPGTTSSSDNEQVHSAPTENKETITEENNSIVSEDSESEEDIDGLELWIVQRKTVNNKKEELFLSLSEKELREKNSKTGRTEEKWFLESIESCIKISNDPVTIQITFDTIKKDRRERVYIMEFADAQMLLKKISALLESRSLTAMNQMAFRCMKCSSVFSQELDKNKLGLLKKSKTVCPTCGSTFVIELDEVPVPSASREIENSVNTTPPYSSIGSADSLQNQDSTGTKSEAPTPRRYDSDIEVISTVSQSSIEVLEVQARMQGIISSNRKRSSEERQTVAVPQLVTVPEIQPNMTGLTESSSSGSLTDSVCTAYENHPPGLNKKVTSRSDTLPEECTTYSSLLDGLLKSVSSKFSKGGSLCTNNHSPVEFSYKNFTQVDHRIKLHLFQQVFQYDNEDVLFLLKGHIIFNSGEDFEGCIVLSTHSLYILKISEYVEPVDNVGNWLLTKGNHPIKDLLNISSVLWCQGVHLELIKRHYLVLLQDSSRTIDFLHFLDGLQKEMKINKKLDLSTDEKLALSELISTINGNKSLQDFSFLSFIVCSSVQIVKGEEEQSFKFMSIFVTKEDIVLLEPSYLWVFKSSAKKPLHKHIQKISNIIDILKDSDLNLLIIQFLDEAENVNEIWILKMETLATLEGLIDSIKGPWESLFLVPLQISEPT
uniref:Serine/threonine-protein kinase 11-interacting protein n=2 Tax=Clastoptera arizonana TaxID=38151 RepID=A0A1B6DEH5_9HEMI